MKLKVSSLNIRIITHTSTCTDLLGISESCSREIAVQNVIDLTVNSRHFRHSILGKNLMVYTLVGRHRKSI